MSRPLSRAVYSTLVGQFASPLHPMHLCNHNIPTMLQVAPNIEDTIPSFHPTLWLTTCSCFPIHSSFKSFIEGFDFQASSIRITSSSSSMFKRFQIRSILPNSTTLRQFSSSISSAVNQSNILGFFKLLQSMVEGSKCTWILTLVINIVPFNSLLELVVWSILDHISSKHKNPLVEYETIFHFKCRLHTPVTCEL